MISVAIVASRVGLSHRGAETFVIELTRRLREEFDITIYSGYQCPAIAENVKTVPIDLPCWASKYFKWYDSLVKRCAIKKGFAGFAGRLIIKVIERLYYPLPDVMEQYFFSRIVFREIEMTRPDILFPNNGVWGARFARHLRKKTGIPYIAIGHGGIGTGEKIVLHLDPDRYIAISGHAAQWARGIFPKAETIHNGVDIERFSTDHTRREEHRTLERPVVLCAAAFTAFKRQKLLVDAVALMEKGTLILLGDGELREDLERYGMERLGNRFVLRSVPFNDMPYWYKLCDVFSLPSLNEPMGIVYIEAMAANRPIVATDDEVRQEVVGEAGILCNVEDTDAYAAALNEAAKRNWGDVPYQRANEFFSWKTVSAKYRVLFNELDEKKNSHEK